MHTWSLYSLPKPETRVITDKKSVIGSIYALHVSQQFTIVFAGFKIAYIIAFFQNKKAPAASQMAVKQEENVGPNMWAAFTWLNRLLGVSVMVSMAYYWAGYLAQLHDNQFWFVNIKVQ